MNDNKSIVAETWDLEIKPKSGLLNFNLKEIWHYRDLMLLFVRHDFVAQHKQTILGPIRYLLQPVLTSIMFKVIFIRLDRIPTNGNHIHNDYMFFLTK